MLIEEPAEICETLRQILKQLLARVKETSQELEPPDLFTESGRQAISFSSIKGGPSGSIRKCVRD